jgi:hypothetical protein
MEGPRQRLIGQCWAVRVDHQPPLVRRYYEGDTARGEPPGFTQTPEQRRASATDRTRMQPSTMDQQRRQGGQTSQYSKKKKKEHGFDDSNKKKD